MFPMCNRIRGLKEWSEIPRTLARSLINFEYNPNVAPTEQVPAFLAERGKPLATRMARFGINLASHGGKRRPPLLNARTDSLPEGFTPLREAGYTVAALTPAADGTRSARHTRDLPRSATVRHHPKISRFGID